MIRHGDRLLLLETFNYHQQFHRIADGELPPEPEWHTVDMVMAHKDGWSDTAFYWTVSMTRESDGARRRMRMGRWLPDLSFRNDEIRAMIVRRVGPRPEYMRMD